METSRAPQSYPQLRRQLFFVRLRQWARRSCDMTGLGPTNLGRMCVVLVFSALQCGVILVACFVLGSPPVIGVSLAIAAFILISWFGFVLLLLGSDSALE